MTAPNGSRESWRDDLETLRVAARLMRDNAEAVPAGPWRVTSDSAKYGGVVAPPTAGHPETEGYGGHLIAESMTGPVRAHVASWSPAVALVVAAWLEAGVYEWFCGDREPMLRVARAFLVDATADVVDDKRDAKARCEGKGCHTAATSEPCCSSHNKRLCHRHYRLTHWVERCIEGCRLCAAEGLPLVLKAGNVQ